MGQSPHPMFCRKTTWLCRGKLGQVIREEQGDCWDHPGQERQRKAAKRGNGRANEESWGIEQIGLCSPMGPRSGDDRKKQMPELGPGCLEHGTPFTSRKSWRKWPGPEERMTQAGLLAPIPPPQSQGLLLSASHSHPPFTAAVGFLQTRAQQV